MILYIRLVKKIVQLIEKLMLVEFKERFDLYIFINVYYYITIYIRIVMINHVDINGLIGQ